MPKPNSAPDAEPKTVRLSHKKAVRRESADALERSLPDVVVTPRQLMARAIAAGNLDMVERMIVLQKRIDDDAAERAFYDAMAHAQAEMTPIFKDASNPQTRSRYASPEAIDRALRPIYSRHGFSLSFDTEDGASEGYVRVVCIVAAHGRKERRHVDMPVTTKGPKGTDMMTPIHAQNSAIAYGVRRLIRMIFNAAETSKNKGGDDDDGNAAGEADHPISAEQLTALKAAIAVCGVGEEMFCNKYGISSPDKLPAALYDEAMGACARFKAQRERKQ